MEYGVYIGSIYLLHVKSPALSPFVLEIWHVQEGTDSDRCKQ